MPIAAIASAGVGILGGIFGASSQRDAERDQRRNNEQQIAATYNQQAAAWQFNEATEQLNYNFAKNSAKLQFEIEKAVALQQWRTSNNLEKARFTVDSTNLEIENLSANAQQFRDFDITRTLQEADHRAQMRAYEQSEKTYSQNTQLIARAATQAYRYEKARLSFERAGINIDSQKIRQGFDDTKKTTTNQAKAVEAQYRSQLRQGGLEGADLKRAVAEKMTEYNTQVKQARNDEGKIKAGFDDTKKTATNQAKAIEAQYRSQLKQAGLQGEELQRAVKEKMGVFTGQADKTRREASGASATAAADGRTGASANRVMDDPFNQANFAIGAMGVELAYFGERQQAALYKLAEETNLAGYLADNQRAQLSQQVQHQERLSNLELGGLQIGMDQSRAALGFFGENQQSKMDQLRETLNLSGFMANNQLNQFNQEVQNQQRMSNFDLRGNNLKERQSIFQANNNIRDNSLQAQSQMNEARSNRMLNPLRPVNIPNPLEIPKAFLPSPFETPRPLAATKGLKPFIPKRGLSAPEPVIGASPNITSQSGNILAQGILSGVGSGVSSYFANKAPSA